MSENKKFIDEEFVDKWSNIDVDECEYNNIIKLVKNDIEAENTITEATFERIINWKSARSKGNIRKQKCEEISKTITESLSTENKLEKLIKIHGIHISIASTILHFIYPDEYPIVDFRTIEALQLLGYIDKDVKMTDIRNSIEGYDSYCSKIFELSKKVKRKL